MLHRIIVIPYVNHYGFSSVSIYLGFLFKKIKGEGELSFPQTAVRIPNSFSSTEVRRICAKKVRELRASLTKDPSNCFYGGLKFGFSTTPNWKNVVYDFYTLNIHNSFFAVEKPGESLHLLDEFKTDIKLTFANDYENLIEKQFSTNAIQQLGFLLYYIYIAKPFIADHSESEEE